MQRKAPTSNYSATSDRGVAVRSVRATALPNRFGPNLRSMGETCWYIGIIGFTNMSTSLGFLMGPQATFSNVSLGILSQSIASYNEEFAVIFVQNRFF